jgi:CRP-like cAMP-binding protein
VIASVYSPNRLLAALPIIEYERLRPRLEQTSLTCDSILYARGDTIRHVFFPLSGVVSLLAVVENGMTGDIGMVGHEGMIGLSLFLRVTTSLGRAVVQGSGTALTMTSDDFVRECEKGGALSRIMLLYARSMFAQIAQSAVCYRFHPTEQRLARRLLMMSDRMAGNELKLRHDTLAKMLGVRREGVTKAAGSLRTKDLISYSRADILILDRAGLEAAACGCYKIIHDEEA